MYFYTYSNILAFSLTSVHVSVGKMKLTCEFIEDGVTFLKTSMGHLDDRDEAFEPFGYVCLVWAL